MNRKELRNYIREVDAAKAGQIQDLRVQVVALDVRVSELEAHLQQVVDLLTTMSDIQRKIVDRVNK